MGREIASSVFLLILVFLLVNNAAGTSSVMTALSSFATGETTALQGRNSSNLNIPSVPQI